VTYLVVVTLSIALTLASSTIGQGVPYIARQAGTHGPIFAAFIVARLTLGVLATRVGFTQIVWKRSDIWVVSVIN
jgi:hypothetical protein